MGVNNLWYVLSELCERKSLTYLSGKYVAVDLSGWVVQAISCEGLNTSRKPHLRNLFFRVSRLLQLGVYPIFVTEGKPPAIKEVAFKKRNHERYTGNGNSNISRPFFDETLQQCQDLLTCLGVPCIRSSGEAEALCSFLCLKGIVSGVITEDNDAFLYGADIVYRDFSIKENDSHVNVYSLKSEKNKLQLNREKLVALALLLGCDYSEGVPGIGRVTAVNLISELSYEDVIQRFKDWKNLSESDLFPGLENDSVKKSAHCKRCGHLGSLSKHEKGGCSSCKSEKSCCLPKPEIPCTCQWHINEQLKCKWKTELKIYNSVNKTCPDFPDEKVIDEYLNFNDTVPCEKELRRYCPNMMKFQEKALNYFGWTFENSHEKILLLITSWQQYQIKNYPGDKADFIYEPVKILKEHNLRDVTYYDVLWKVIDSCNDSNRPTENLVTQEYGDQFSACYKEIVDSFYNEKVEQIEKKESKGKAKKLKTGEGNRKVKVESTMQCFDIPSSQNIISPRTSPYNDSFNGMLDIPLWERIKIMPKVLFEDYNKSPVSNAVHNTNEIFNVFSDCSDFSEILSPVSKNLSIPRFEVKCADDLEQKMDFSVNNAELVAVTDPFLKNFKSIHHVNVKHSICLDSNDSDASFLSMLMDQEEKCVYINNFEQVQIKREQLNQSSTVELVMNSSKGEIYNKNMEYIQNFCSPCGKMSDLNLRLLYSVNQSTSTPKSICSDHLFSKIVNDTSLLLENEIFSANNHLSTPKSSKLLSTIIYSPLMFDSSTDDI